MMLLMQKTVIWVHGLKLKLLLYRLKMVLNQQFFIMYNTRSELKLKQHLLLVLYLYIPVQSATLTCMGQNLPFRFFFKLVYRILVGLISMKFFLEIIIMLLLFCCSYEGNEISKLCEKDVRPRASVMLQWSQVSLFFNTCILWNTISFLYYTSLNCFYRSLLAKW